MAEGKLPALREEMFVAVTLALECGEAIRATTSAKTMWKDAQGIDPVTATGESGRPPLTTTGRGGVCSPAGGERPELGAAGVCPATAAAAVWDEQGVGSPCGWSPGARGG